MHAQMEKSIRSLGSSDRGELGFFESSVEFHRRSVSRMLRLLIIEEHKLQSKQKSAIHTGLSNIASAVRRDNEALEIRERGYVRGVFPAG